MGRGVGVKVKEGCGYPPTFGLVKLKGKEERRKKKKKKEKRG